MIDWRDELVGLGKFLVVAVFIGFWALVAVFAILMANWPASWAAAIRGVW